MTSTLQQRLLTLSQCGIGTRDSDCLDSLLMRRGELLAEGGYASVLACLGEQQDDDERRFLSDDIWLIRMECINGPGDYANVVRRGADLTKGDLNLRAIEDHVDLAQSEAWVSFLLDGVRHRVPCDVNGR